MERESVFLFLYLFVLATYIKWYKRTPDRNSSCKILAAGVAMAVVVNVAVNLVSLRVPSLEGKAIYIVQNEWMLPVTLMGFGMFFLFLGFEWKNSIINRVAKWAFPCYLINAYPAMKLLLWSSIFKLEEMYSSPILPVLLLGPLLAVYVASGIAEELKELLFRFAIGRNKGRMFESVWESGKARALRRGLNVYIDN